MVTSSGLSHSLKSVSAAASTAARLRAASLRGRLDGKEAIAAYMRHYPDHVDVHDFPDVRIHQTVDPEVIVVEMRGVGRLVETGSPFDVTYIAVVTVQEGLITSYRDYWNPLAVQQPGFDVTASGTR
ncbi:nuclear transport factor 2 family protein [Streptomyces sp. NBC_00878]|uniref:nuclear transport factor 2 family protein n=1 Tax=Streptomyces sp. NBC_00878 TaxID=2975854 RepID=UPI002251E8D1|nr:nuclear transport factor 2 family protein [Streptomyces sp. NBC_00878]MCX4902985.1 nuclear transport factor 2 family protein [Streptomyces sp. NBC_00878]